MKKNGKQRSEYLLLGLVGAVITLLIVINGYDIWRILPLYVSLVIYFLRARVSRWAPFLGGLNSLFYAMVDYSYGLYAMMVFDVLFSCPVQIATFVNWTRRSEGKVTKLRSLKPAQRGRVGALFAVCWIGLYLLRASAGTKYMLLDNTTTLLGLAVMLLMMLAYVEYSPLSCVNIILTLVMNVVMTVDNPERMTYVVFSLYGTICDVREYLTLRKTGKKD